MKISTNELASLDLSHWRLGPTGQGTPHVSGTKIEHDGCDGAGMASLAGGYFSGDTKGTRVFYSSMRIDRGRLWEGRATGGNSPTFMAARRRSSVVRRPTKTKAVRPKPGVSIRSSQGN